ncbi:hypothetical protein APV43_06745 [Staphylococcus aureus]|nr:hypothetical protein APV43_06745 [Staphylococcus aureus]
MNLNDTIFMFLCTLLVWLMTPGLSLFYGGLVQSKNALNTVMQSMAAIVLVTFVWITVGFTISFDFKSCDVPIPEPHSKTTLIIDCLCVATRSILDAK